MFFLLSASVRVRARAACRALLRGHDRGDSNSLPPKERRCRQKFTSIDLDAGLFDVDPDLPAFRLPFTAPDGQHVDGRLFRFDRLAMLLAKDRGRHAADLRRNLRAAFARSAVADFSLSAGVNRLLGGREFRDVNWSRRGRRGRRRGSVFDALRLRHSVRPRGRQRVGSLLARVNPQARLRQQPQLAEAWFDARGARVHKHVAELHPVDKSRIGFKTDDGYVGLLRLVGPRLAGDFDVDLAAHRLSVLAHGNQGVGLRLFRGVLSTIIFRDRDSFLEGADADLHGVAHAVAQADGRAGFDARLGRVEEVYAGVFPLRLGDA